jgi:rare lipoprotein A
VGAGTTRVEVRTIAPPLDAARTAAVSVPASPSAAAAERMYVQIGAFAQHENAERLVARLRASGFSNPIVFSAPNDRRRLHRVRLGPIRDAGEFDDLSARLRAIGVSGSQLVVDRSP